MVEPDHELRFFNSKFTIPTLLDCSAEDYLELKDAFKVIKTNLYWHCCWLWNSPPKVNDWTEPPKKKIKSKHYAVLWKGSIIQMKYLNLSKNFKKSMCNILAQHHDITSWTMKRAEIKYFHKTVTYFLLKTLLLLSLVSF